MQRSAVAITSIPYALVVALAVGLAIGAVCATPGGSPSAAATPSVPPAGTATTTPSASTNTAVASALTRSATPGASGSDAAEMLRVHNELRAAVSAPVLRGDDRVTAAAQRHAEYLAANNTIGHEESAGAVGFTGATVRDRLAAQGYTGATASEVATSFGSGVDGVRSLWLLPYHRLGLMHPHAIVAGWGHAEAGGRSTTVGVIVYDFGSPAPDVIRSPASGQRVQGSWDGEESPDVLPAGAARPVGYPVMLVAAGAKNVDLRSAHLVDAAGHELATYVVPQIYERDYVALVPARPLDRGARYHVRLDLVISGVDSVEEWEFLTEP